MPLPPSEHKRISDLLKAAEAAHHNIMTGRAIRVLVDQNGERVEYVAANAGRLALYIRDLKASLGHRELPVGPMGVYF